MKKLKLLPTVLMLVLCVGVLAVGVFAITPTKNTISGTITVTSSNPEVEIQVVQVTKNELGEDVETPIGSKYTVRAGVDLEFGNIQFNTATANQVTDVNDIIVRLDVTNKSSEDLGMYFATSASVNAGTAKTESIDVVANVLQAQFSDYTKLPKTNGTASSSVTFHLKDFPTSDVNLELDTLTLYFNIEPFNGNLVVKDDAYYEALGDYAIIGKGKTTISSLDVNLGGKTKVKVADSVNTISSGTFENVTIEDLVFPSLIESIEECAFEGITINGKIDLSACTKLTEIDSWAIDLIEVKNIIYPNTIKTIKSNAFYIDMESITWLPKTIEVIEDYAFAFELEGLGMAPSYIRVIDLSYFTNLKSVGQCNFHFKYCFIPNGVNVDTSSFACYADSGSPINGTIYTPDTKYQGVEFYAYWWFEDGSSDYDVPYFHNVIIADDAYEQFKTAAEIN